MTGTAPLLEVKDLNVTYHRPRLLDWLRKPRSPSRPVVAGLSFRVVAGETMALVGESGSGKSTILRAIEGLIPVSAGIVRFQGEDISRPIRARSQDIRRRLQIVFQNPDASLNPKSTIAEIIGRPLTVFHGISGAARAACGGIAIGGPIGSCLSQT